MVTTFKLYKCYVKNTILRLTTRIFSIKKLYCMQNWLYKLKYPSNKWNNICRNYKYTMQINVHGMMYTDINFINKNSTSEKIYIHVQKIFCSVFCVNFTINSANTTSEIWFIQTGLHKSCSKSNESNSLSKIRTPDNKTLSGNKKPFDSSTSTCKVARRCLNLISSFNLEHFS